MDLVPFASRVVMKALPTSYARCDMDITRLRGYRRLRQEVS
jgi:hypothetical protein